MVLAFIMMSWLEVCLVCLLLQQTFAEVNYEELSIILPEDYDRNAPPKVKAGGQRFKVEMSISLNRIFDISEKSQMISIDAIVRMRWNDTRLNVSLPKDDTFGYVVSTRDSLKDLVWYPDLYIISIKDIRKPSFGLSPQFLRIYPNGHVMSSAMSNFDIHCPMDFSWYPVDVQECNVVFESYSTVEEMMDLGWYENAVDISRMNQHKFQVFFTKGNRTYETGVYPRLVMHIKLERDLSFHLSRTYIPSMFFVTLAWTSMFIPCEHLPGRVALSITTLLTLAAMYNSLLSITPPISYITKLDVWIIGCFMFVCATLFETVLVVYVRYHHPDFLGKSNCAVGPNPRAGGTPRNADNHEKLALKIDKWSAVSFFVGYLAFCIAYWADLVGGQKI